MPDDKTQNGDDPWKEHISVMPTHVMDWLLPQEGETYLDGTLGLGGHAMMIGKVLGASGRVIGLDRDTTALEKAGVRLQQLECRVDLVHSRYSEMVEAAASIGVEKVDRILLDIGVSSMQLDQAERGFSFMREGPLDMRMDSSRGQTAQDLVLNWSVEELERIFREYGEERFSGKVARTIGEKRGRIPINTTSDLAKLVESVIPRRGKIHPATRVFQALRIAVNDELGELERGIEAAVKLLSPGGRLALITFHSLEDRLAKYRFRDLKDAGLVSLPTKKVVKPKYEECRGNRRARSAKLRILEKI